MKSSQSFKMKIKKLFWTYAIIPLLLLVVLFLIFSIFNSKYITKKQAHDSSLTISKKLNDVNNSYLHEIELMTNDETVIEYVKSLKDSHKVYEKFYNFNKQQMIKSNIFIFNSDGVLLLTNAGNADEVSQSVMDKINSSTRSLSNGKTVREAISAINKNGRLSVYLYGSNVMEENKKIGSIFYLLHEDDFQNLIYNETSSILVVTDEYDNIIATTNNRVIGFLNRFRPTIDHNGYAVFGESQFYMSKVQVPESPIFVIALNSLQHQSTLFFWLACFLSLVTIMLMIVLRFLSIRLSNNVTVSIDKLLYAMKMFHSGNMSYYLNIKSGDEFEVLAKQYNAMLDRINYLLHQNTELSERKRVSEVKQLESQFNPHFIFNVLETIRYSVVIDPKQAQKSILSLSRLLRYSVENNKSHIKLEEDITYLLDYLSLHKARYSDRLHYSIEMEDELKTLLVPKLLIQPIVENSIKHGYAKKETLKIKVKIFVKEENLIVSVTDNGGGMDEILLETTTYTLSSEETTPQQMGIGLFNVHRRLVLLYEQNRGIDLENTEDGLIVQFSIPTNKLGSAEHVQSINC